MLPPLPPFLPYFRNCVSFLLTYLFEQLTFRSHTRKEDKENSVYIHDGRRGLTDALSAAHNKELQDPCLQSVAV